MAQALSRDPFRADPAQSRVLTAKNVNQSVLKAEYAVRGEIALLAEDLRAKTNDPKQKKDLPFDEVVSCNIGPSIAHSSR